ncbi:unnamed protein product [Brassica oleracea var. botrytis]|nr:unnamed protein product [Brassica napus]CDY17115.1 BnaC06g00480D [Brassica napus]
MNMEIQLPSDDIITVEFEYIKIEKHCFTYFSLFHEDENCPVKPRHSLPIKERKLGITQRIALQRIEADNRMIVGGTKKRGVARSPVQGVSLRKTYVARTMNPTCKRLSVDKDPALPCDKVAVLSWNCHGLGSVLAIRRLRELHKRIIPDVTFLMEAKNSDEFVKKKTKDFRFPNYFSVPPVGLSGGLSLLWKKGVDLTILEALPNLIDTTITFKGVTSFVTFVYGAPAAENRAAFWAKLNEVGAGRDTSWLITGDFNDILDNSEKVGGPARWEGSFTSFRSFVSQHGLWNLTHSGNHLSWIGNRYTHFIRSRLDRSLTNCPRASSFRWEDVDIFVLRAPTIALWSPISTPQRQRGEEFFALIEH